LAASAGFQNQPLGSQHWAKFSAGAGAGAGAGGFWALLEIADNPRAKEKRESLTTMADNFSSPSSLPKFLGQA